MNLFRKLKTLYNNHFISSHYYIMFARTESQYYHNVSKDQAIVYGSLTQVIKIAHRDRLMLKWFGFNIHKLKSTFNKDSQISHETLSTFYAKDNLRPSILTRYLSRYER